MYSDYLKSKHWKETRQHKLAEHSSCQICGSTKNLNIHHKRYTHNSKSVLNNEKLSTLITLCSSCHRLAHKYIGVGKYKINKRILQIKRLMQLGCNKKMAFACTINTEIFCSVRDKLLEMQ